MVDAEFVVHCPPSPYPPTACRIAGAGLYVKSLERQLRRRGLTPPLLEHDLVAEMRGERQDVLPGPPSETTR